VSQSCGARDLTHPRRLAQSPSITNEAGKTVSGPISEDCPEFGVLFVAGFADQRPGTAIASFAGALYRWLFRWNARPHPRSA
jgi:hypothetical protein